MKTVILLNGDFGRNVDIWPAKAECQICKVEKNCLGFDTSDEEYSPGFLCKDCINTFLEKWDVVV